MLMAAWKAIRLKARTESVDSAARSSSRSRRGDCQAQRSRVAAVEAA
jgi:hypothetical protein